MPIIGIKERIDCGTWQQEGIKYRSLRFKLLPTDGQKEILMDLKKRRQNVSIFLSNQIHSLFLNKTISVYNIKKYSYDLVLRDSNDTIFTANKFERQNEKEDICSYVRNRYNGYFQRNKKLPDSSISFRKLRGVQIGTDIIKIVPSNQANGSLILQLRHKQKPTAFPEMPLSIDIQYTIPGTMWKYLPYISKSINGYLVLEKNEQWWFHTRASIPIEWQYIPDSCIGFDINKGKNDFITFSKPIIMNGKKTVKFTRPNDMNKIISDIKLINGKISDKKYKSSQRRALRKKWFRKNISNLSI